MVTVVVTSFLFINSSLTNASTDSSTTSSTLPNSDSSSTSTSTTTSTVVAVPTAAETASQYPNRALRFPPYTRQQNLVQVDELFTKIICNGFGL